MRGLPALHLALGGASERLCSVQSISYRRIGSALQWRRRVLPSSDSRVDVLQRSGTQRKDAFTIALRTERRWMSPPPSVSPQSPPALAGNRGTDSASDSGHMPATSHGGIRSDYPHAVPQPAATMGSGSSSARHRFSRRRRRHGATKPEESSNESIQTVTPANTSDADVPRTSSDAACMHSAPPCASQPLYTATSDAHSAMSPVQQRLCQLIGTGAWHEALEVLRCHEQEDVIATHRTQASSESTLHLHRGSALAGAKGAEECLATPFICVSQHEASVWLLLWCGYGAAAWHVWRRSMQALSSPSSPRLLLPLTLFAHVVEGDATRTRDMLLLFEMMRGGAATSPSETEIGHMCKEKTASSSRMWRHLLWQWLWCCNECTTSSKGPSQFHRRSLASFLEGAVEQLARCAFASSETPTGQRMGAMAEAVTLLLLALRDVHCTRDKWHHMLREELAAVCEGNSVQGSRNSCCNASTPQLAEHAKFPPWASPPARELIGEAVRSVLWSASSTEDSLGRDDGESAAQQQCRARLRTIFSNAQRKLQHPRGRCSPAAPAGDEEALRAFRLLHEQLMESEGLGGIWIALRSALRLPPAQPHLFSLHQPTIPASAAGGSLQLLWRCIANATARGDWATALRLCFSYGFCDGASGKEKTEGSNLGTQYVIGGAVTGSPACRLSTPAPAPVDLFPFFHRLGKALIACEAAQPTGVSWQGALALWNVAQEYYHLHAECPSSPSTAGTAEEIYEPLCVAPSSRGLAQVSLPMSRVFGRILFLLASAGRWVEALACFHDTPDAYLDGFVVSQVAYALRCCPAQNRAVLDLWAAWRCRVGDAVDPTETMIHKLLVAMLRTSAVANTPVATLSSSSQPPAMVAAKVATAVLVAAADTPPSAPATSVTDTRRAAVTPGTAVPLDWLQRRDIVRSIVADRWVGGWADALRVALASCDVPLLLNTVLPRVPSAHSPGLYSDVRRVLQEKGVVLSPAERVTLLTLCGKGRKLRLGRDSSGCAGNAASPTEAAVPTEGESSGARQYVLHTETLLDELLGFD
ncbi:hypothetical protein LSCM4_04927 [Leishmania orientalis]|uniref:Uncharacterized protein n=1 Tax=Leishmania orientalis TaxID=2249476 RepID=A0A836KZP4_9TRYP|nr:hypothetical protein LSCM4_04927 [Leishmania orientalis]